MGIARKADKEWFFQHWAKTHGGCFWCGKRFGKGLKRPTIEHFIPLSRGGFDHSDNMVVAHSSCNAARCNPLPNEAEMRRFVAVRGKDAIHNLTLFSKRLELMVSGASVQHARSVVRPVRLRPNIWERST